MNIWWMQRFGKCLKKLEFKQSSTVWCAFVMLSVVRIRSTLDLDAPTCILSSHWSQNRMRLPNVTEKSNDANGWTSINIWNIRMSIKWIVSSFKHSYRMRHRESNYRAKTLLTNCSNDNIKFIPLKIIPNDKSHEFFPLFYSSFFCILFVQSLNFGRWNWNKNTYLWKQNEYL